MLTSSTLVRSGTPAPLDSEVPQENVGLWDFMAQRGPLEDQYWDLRAFWVQGELQDAKGRKETVVKHLSTKPDLENLVNQDLLDTGGLKESRVFQVNTVSSGPQGSPEILVYRASRGPRASGGLKVIKATVLVAPL